MRWLPLALLACTACADDTPGEPIDPNDIDADGIPNTVDLCPKKQDPAQHDEDRDGVGDVCDNCPATPNPDQIDLSETLERQFPDAVGDACDRRPKLADDTIARFFPFADASEASAFSGTGWTLANDQVRGTAARWISRRSEAGDGISMQVHVSQLAWPQPAGELSLAVDGNGVDSGFVCRIVHSASDDVLEIYEIGGARSTAPVGPFAPTDRLVLTLSRAYTQLATGHAGCFLSVNGGMELRIDIPTIDDLAIGSYAFATADADVAIDAALVMTTPFACDTPLTSGANLACP